VTASERAGARQLVVDDDVAMLVVGFSGWRRRVIIADATATAAFRRHDGHVVRQRLDVLDVNSRNTVDVVRHRRRATAGGT